MSGRITDVISPLARVSNPHPLMAYASCTAPTFANDDSLLFIPKILNVSFLDGMHVELLNAVCVFIKINLLSPDFNCKRQPLGTMFLNMRGNGQ